LDCETMAMIRRFIEIAGALARFVKCHFVKVATSTLT
jgi:hypothetical protein